ncbi:hypothetical protein ACFL40_01805 [candidate division KSB1 bacterium]
MAGKVKRMIDSILEQRSRGDPVLQKTTKAKLMLKGINPDKFTYHSEDDPVVIKKLNNLMQELI